MPALELGGEFWLEAVIVRSSYPPACADADEGGGGGDNGEHVPETREASHYLHGCKLGLTATPVRLMGMSDDARRFRNRATDCRNLAKSARNSVDAAMLEDIAAELDEEADKIEEEESAKPSDA